MAAVRPDSATTNTLRVSEKPNSSETSGAGQAVGAASRQRLTQLDVLRFVAIFLVMGHHVVIAPVDAGVMTPLADFWRNLGWTGVDMFFVLSGFLIGGLLFGELRKHGKLDVKRFIIRRGFKIWPLYLGYVVVMTFMMMTWQQISPRQAFREMLPFYAHVQNYAMRPEMYTHFPVAHLWSLAVEEHFYLLLPLLLVFLARRAKDPTQAIPGFPRAAALIMLSCLLLRWLNWHVSADYVSEAVSPSLTLRWHGQGNFVPEQHQWPTHLRIDSLVCGVLLAYFWHYDRAVLRPLLARPGLLLAVGIGMLAAIYPFLWNPNFTCTIGYTLLYICFACMLLACMATTLPEHQNGRMAASFRARPLQWLASVGFYSYPIYLLHLWIGRKPVEWLLHKDFLLSHLGLHWIVITGLYVICACVVGAICGQLIEKPTLALRNRLFPASHN